MKKKLEADLISIAHRILKLKNKEDVRELHLETQKLYEKLSVLLFVEENFNNIKPEIVISDIENAMNADKIIAEEKPKPLLETLLVEQKTEVVLADISFLSIDESPIMEISKLEEDEEEEISEDTIVESSVPEIAIPEVEKSEEIKEVLAEKVEKPENKKTSDTKYLDIPVIQEFVFDKIDAVNLNDKLKKSINIGLNDKIAFEKNLFGGSSEDFNRVISQISTFDNLREAKNFIDEMVKPDYDNWQDQEEFAERFMEIVESKFS